TSIGADAFLGAQLKNISIPNSVTNIGERAFRNCTNLTSVYIPDSVLTIGDQALEACYALTNLSIPPKFIADLSRIGVDQRLGNLASTTMIQTLASAFDKVLHTRCTSSSEGANDQRHLHASQF
ncbi:MAG: leucine-rich repeat domain-containing protein, partial [Proteobacteria bacterium]|nr:leucine-rich repeat domain-containing protein [Pseudomonadota bacterium]